MPGRRAARRVGLALVAGLAALPGAAQDLGPQGGTAGTPSVTTPAPEAGGGNATGAQGQSGVAGQGATVPMQQDGGANGSVTIPSPVLTLDPDRLFSDSEYGKRVEQDLEAQARSLAAENRRIESELSNEEKELTKKRAKLPPDEFRKLADAFDSKVQGIRKAQDAKRQELSQRREAERQKFLQIVIPILGGLIRDNGAVAILNRQAIFLSFKSIDITDRAIRRIDEKIGDGAALDTTGTQPAGKGGGVSSSAQDGQGAGTRDTAPPAPHEAAPAPDAAAPALPGQ